MSLAFRVRLLDEVASTNDEVKRALEAGEPEGLVVRARRQAAGYGRQGRTWTSPEGGLYCSLLLRPQAPPSQLPTLSLVVGLAVRRALAGLAPEVAPRIQVKWPNDVVLSGPLCHPGRAQAPLCHPERAQASLRHPGRAQAPLCHPERAKRVEGSPAAPAVSATADAALRASAQDDNRPAKLCGISLEGHAGGVCVGVGVNVRPPAERPDVGGKNRAAYVADLAAVSVEDVLAAFLAAFAPLYGEWTRDGFAPLVDEFNAHVSLTGCDVRMVDRDGTAIAAGTVERVDASGRLILRDAAGVETPVASGEAHLA
ncbi:biotin--[acetyl-CoA-carboxylase] ligase [Arabiibacter massiliensis]|uniref:biotin--[acetyl-CoA-carboxylase] ligase n=1 Tax=Arabiibacter massiliensis TaxID=1870985 RepID=UPI001E5C108F|nr:biotin--[acetyl-CoA-carboxylase] ligase [Arabiibacter massiliensis]